jgi:hypothetical protein
MAEEQDKTHRLLFHFPRMIKDLIRLCLGGEWVERLDFDTLERVPERLLSKELVRDAFSNLLLRSAGLGELARFPPDELFANQEFNGQMGVIAVHLEVE